jgi:hypothetical protein
MCSGSISEPKLREAVDSAYPFGMDEEEDPSCKRVKAHLQQVLEYLEGRRDQL